jgi:hypothetical protein
MRTITNTLPSAIAAAVMISFLGSSPAFAAKEIEATELDCDVPCVDLHELSYNPATQDELDAEAAARADADNAEAAARTDADNAEAAARADADNAEAAARADADNAEAAARADADNAEAEAREDGDQALVLLVGDLQEQIDYLQEQIDYLGGDVTVFVTSVEYTGDLVASAQLIDPDFAGDGLAAADLICSQHAQDGGLEANFVAWLSDSVTDAKDRLPPTGLDGSFVRTDGAVVANDLDDLLDGSLDLPINTTEYGVPLPTTGRVWTSTLTDGTRKFPSDPAPYLRCGDWTVDDAFGIGAIGFAAYNSEVPTGVEWTEFVQINCDLGAITGGAHTAHLYCFGR